jgi:large subunit ribosomal protein L19
MKASHLTKETILHNNLPDRNFPDFRVGDTIEVALLVKEGTKERTQLFEGDVIAGHNNGIASTFVIRRIGANNIGVEKILPYYSPTITSIRLVREGKVRRAKLFYLRDREGKSAKIQERILTKEEKIRKAEHAAEVAKAAEPVQK